MALRRVLAASLPALAAGVRVDGGGDLDLALTTELEGSTNRPFILRIGSVKMDGFGISERVVPNVAAHLAGPVDGSSDPDIFAFYETDTQRDEAGALWGGLRRKWTDDGYMCNTRDQPIEMVESRFHMLTVCVKPDRGLSISEVPLEMCCALSAKGAVFKSILFSDGGELLLMGAGITPKDDKKVKQTSDMLAYVEGKAQVAAAGGRKFQAVFAGDVNDRMVLPTGTFFWQKTEDSTKTHTPLRTYDDFFKSLKDRKKFGKSVLGGKMIFSRHRINQTEVLVTDEKKGKSKTVRVGQLSQKTREWFTKLARDPHSRVTLLKLDSSYFNGMSVQMRKRDLQELHLGKLFKTMKDWWRELLQYRRGDLQLPPLTYKRTPWMEIVKDCLSGYDGADAEVFSGIPHTEGEKGDFATETPEIMNAIFRSDLVPESAKQNCQEMLYPDSEASMWKMRGKIPKTDKKTDGVQTYLNLDENGNPVYLQLGWLDAVGILRPDQISTPFASAEFRDFNTNTELRVFDHSMSSATVELVV